MRRKQNRGAVKIRTQTYDSGAAQLIKSSTCCDVIVPGSTAGSTVCADPYVVGLSRSQAYKPARILTALRQAAARLQKELGAATRKAEQGMSRHRDDVQKLQSQRGNLRQQVGVLEGNLGALRTANARYADEAAQARNQRDQLALSLTNAAAKQKVSTAKRIAKSTADPRKRSGPVGKSPRTKKL